MGAPSAIRAAVRREVLDALGQSENPLTNRELREHCPSARHTDDISASLNVLKGKGLIVECTPRSGLRTYRRATPYHQTQETPMPSPVTPAIHPMPGAPLTSATGSGDGDEHYQTPIGSAVYDAIELASRLPGLIHHDLAELLAFDPETAVSAITWRQRPNHVVEDEVSLTLSLCNPGASTYPLIQTSGRFSLDSAESLHRLADIAAALVKRHDIADLVGEVDDE